MNNRPGTLIVRPICGKLLRDTDFLTKMDPYCVIACGSQRQKTRIASGAGKTPNWSDQLVFKKNFEDMISISVWDYDGNSKDDLIGEGSVSISRITATPNWEDWVDIVYKGRKSGEVRLNVTFTPDANAQGAYPQGGTGMHGAPPTTIVYMNYPPQPPPYPAYPPSGYGTVPQQAPPSYPAYPPSYPAYPPAPPTHHQPAYPPAPQGPPGYPAVPQGAPGYSTIPQGPPGYPAAPQGAPGYSTVPQGAPGYSTVPQGPPGYSTVPQGAPGYPPPHQAPPPGYPPSGYAPSQGSYPGGSYPGHYPPQYPGYPQSY